MRTLLRWMLAGIAAALVAAPAVAQTETVVVDDSLFDSFTSGGNPGCGGCGLLDWDDTHNNGWGCRRLPSGGRGALCGGENNPPDPDWDDATALTGSIGIQSVLPRRLDGLVTEFNDGPMDPDPDSFPPWDPSVSGAIQSLTGTYAFRHTGSNEISTTIRGHLLIKQDGDFYLSDHSVPASTGSGGSLGSWVEVGKNGSGDLVVFTADDFDLILSDESVDGSVHPDFSESGAPLFFGFAVDLSFNGTIPNPPGFLNRGFNVDAIQITVISASSEEPSALPVPGLAPLGIGGLALLFAAAGAATLRRIRRSGLPL